MVMTMQFRRCGEDLRKVCFKEDVIKASRNNKSNKKLDMRLICSTFSKFIERVKTLEINSGQKGKFPYFRSQFQRKKYLVIQGCRQSFLLQLTVEISRNIK